MHLPEAWYLVCGMLLCVSLCIMPRCIRIHYEPYVNWFSFYYPQEFKLYFQEAWKSSSNLWIVKASKRELYQKQVSVSSSSATWLNLKLAVQWMLTLVKLRLKYHYHQSKGDAIESDDVRRLQKTYEAMYAGGRIIHVSSFCDKFKHLLYKGYRCAADSACN